MTNFQTSKVTIDQVAFENLKLRLSTNQKSKIGKEVAMIYRRKFPDSHLHTVPKYCNGEMREVKSYPRSFASTIEECIKMNIDKFMHVDIAK